MSEESIKSSNDLIRWLKMLALPAWAKFILASIMLLILFSSLGLLLWGLRYSDHESISSAVAMLTVGLPVGLIVVALVFGDGGARKLKALTQSVLTKEVPEAILENLSPHIGDSRYTQANIKTKIRGCIADYELSVNDTSGHRVTLEFKLELNVKKINFVLWVPGETDEAPLKLSQRLDSYQSCFFGAGKEGYIQNQAPLHGERKVHIGLIFIKTLGEDFLLDPAQRLYFSQDFAFFIRGLLDAEASHD
jgi:hypothetical protein